MFCHRYRGDYTQTQFNYQTGTVLNMVAAVYQERSVWLVGCFIKLMKRIVAKSIMELKYSTIIWLVHLQLNGVLNTFQLALC